MKTVALIGPTASGKSDLALRLAHENNCYILSIDSLSVYRGIDIASAKPSRDELSLVPHFGIDILNPDEHFSVQVFLACYEEARQAAMDDGKHLLIIGGTSFYLKTLLTGLSPLPEISERTLEDAAVMLHDLEHAYSFLKDKDPEYMRQIEPTDRYRIEKMLHLALQTGMSPTEWFKANPPEPVIEALPLFDIHVDRAVLRERITLRTDKMLATGLIDEVARLELDYTRSPNSMKAIGIIEVLEYLDGLICLEAMREQIITHTAQLAKRQQTFNKNQFSEKVSGSVDELYEAVSRLFE
jgi:tRNA dimethylallyltransferase